MWLETHEGRGTLTVFVVSSGERVSRFVADTTNEGGLQTSVEWVDQTGGGVPLPGVDRGDVQLPGHGQDPATTGATPES